MRLSESAAIVGVDAQPMHVAPARDLVGADNRHVVLGLAGDDAGVAADAGRDIDHHRPLVWADVGRGMLRIERCRRRSVGGSQRGGGDFRKSGGTEKIASLDTGLRLSRKQFGAAPGRHDRHPHGPQRLAGA